MNPDTSEALLGNNSSSSSGSGSGSGSGSSSSSSVMFISSQSKNNTKINTWYTTTSNYAGGHQKSQWLIVLVAMILVINVVLQPVRATVRGPDKLWSMRRVWLTFRELSLWDICTPEQMIHCNLFSHIYTYINTFIRLRTIKHICIYIWQECDNSLTPQYFYCTIDC